VVSNRRVTGKIGSELIKADVVVVLVAMNVSERVNTTLSLRNVPNSWSTEHPNGWRSGVSGSDRGVVSHYGWPPCPVHSPHGGEICNTRGFDDASPVHQCTG
jgi:hypothetical protein